jgi:predicted GNAT superfamily acetyltransferase
MISTQIGKAGQVLIRKLSSPPEMESVVQLQQEIWGYGKEGSDQPYPARALLSISDSGGLVSGAFLAEQLVGFSLAWIGRERSSRRSYLHSQLVGVLPSFRHLGIGSRLKFHQREYAQEEDLELIRWTFDPLRAVNANLNLRKLGVVCQAYERNFYGRLNSYFSRGMESDRLWASWYVNSERVSQRLDGRVRGIALDKLPCATACETIGVEGYRLKRIRDSYLDLEAPGILIEIPDHFNLILAVKHSLALEWQRRIRELFHHYLSCGYIVDDFSSIERKGLNLGFYHLTNRSLQDLLAQSR